MQKAGPLKVVKRGRKSRISEAPFTNLFGLVEEVDEALTGMGVGKYLKERNPAVIIIAVESSNASALLGHEPGPYKIEGMGDGFVPVLPDRAERYFSTELFINRPF